MNLWQYADPRIIEIARGYERLAFAYGALAQKADESAKRAAEGERLCVLPFQKPGSLKDHLADFIVRFPFEDLGSEFQRGMLSGLISAYELGGFDQNDARFIAGQKLLYKMSAFRE